MSPLTRMVPGTPVDRAVLRYKPQRVTMFGTEVLHETMIGRHGPLKLANAVSLTRDLDIKDSPA